MTFKNNIKTIKKRYSEALSENIVQHVHKISEALNSNFMSYETKINALRNLIAEGGVNISLSQELNKSLVNELYKLRTVHEDKHLFAPITISPLSIKEADKLIEDLFQKLEMQHGDFYYYFNKKITDTFYVQGSEFCLIQFHKHLNKNGEEFSQADMNYTDLVEQYIENYTKLISGEAISWDRKTLNDYIKFLENNIYLAGDDIEEKINTIVTSVICAPVLQIKETFFDQSQITELKQRIQEIVNNLVEERTSDFDDLINDYKAKFVSSINVLFESMNLEQFPDSVSTYIESRRSEDNEFFDEVLEHIQIINDKRDDLEEDLKLNGLYKFIDYAPVSNLLASEDYVSVELTKNVAQERFSSLVSTPDSVLGTFMKERNEYSVIIENLLDTESGDYAELITKMNEFKFSEDTTKNKINLAVLNSLESLAIELKSAYISTLSVKYRSFYNGDLIEIRSSFTRVNNTIHSLAKEQLESTILRESSNLIDLLMSSQKDKLSVLLNDEVIELNLNQWLGQNVKDWRHLGLWKPNKDELHKKIEELFVNQMEDFLVKKSNFLTQQLSTNLGDTNLAFPIIQKIGNISKDALKLVTIIKSLGAAIPLFIEEENQETLQCTNSLESLIHELQFKINEKELEQTKELLIEKAEAGPEILNEYIETLKEKHELKTTFTQAILSKINHRYNVFSNKKDVVSKLKKEIMTIRDSLDLEIQKEFISLLQQKKNELELTLKDPENTETLLNDN